MIISPASGSLWAVVILKVYQISVLKKILVMGILYFLNIFVQNWQILVLCTGPGVLPYFAGAGAGVCSPPAKLRQHLFVLQTSIIDQ